MRLMRPNHQTKNPNVPSSLEGVAQLTAQLTELGKAVTGKALRSSVRAGIKPAQKRAIELIPKGSTAHRTYKGRLVGPGFASRNTRVITTLSPDNQKATAILGVRKEAFYATQFVERNKGKSKLTGRPWLRPAFESTLSLQQEALAKQLKKRVEAAARGAKVAE